VFPPFLWAGSRGVPPPAGPFLFQDNRPYLDLAEIGRAVSQSVGSTVREQTSVTWGLNLYGQGEFARNPSFPDDPTRRRPPVEIAPGTAAGSKVQEYSEALWLHYQSLAAEPSYKDLADLLRTVCEDIEEGGASALPFVRGVATSFRARSASSPDLLAESDVVALWWAPREFACVSRELDPCLRPPRPRPPRLGALL
jgi:hypothetical protein